MKRIEDMDLDEKEKQKEYERRQRVKAIKLKNYKKRQAKLANGEDSAEHYFSDEDDQDSVEVDEKQRAIDIQRKKDYEKEQ